MRRWIFFAVSLMIICISFSATVEFYESKTCPHCARIKPILYQLKEKYGFELKDVVIEDNPKAWREMIEKYGLNDLVVGVNDTFIQVTVGTPTMIINGEYIMIGEFWSNGTTCLKVEDFYICPSSEDLFIQLVNGKKPNYIETKRFSFSDMKNYFNKEECVGAMVGYAPIIYCKTGYYYLPDFVFFSLLEKTGSLSKVKDIVRSSFENVTKENTTKEEVPQAPLTINEGNSTSSNEKIFKGASILSLGVILGISDGILNPCTISVIILLVSYLISKGFHKRRILYCGLSFIFGVFLVYFLFLEGLVCAFFKIPEDLQVFVNNFLGVLLIIFGIIEMKDFFFYGKGVSLKIPEGAKKKFERFLKVGTVVSSFILGFLAGSAEIPCAGIYPPTYARAVTLLTFDMKIATLYVLWYMFWFVFPLSMIVLTVYLGILKSEKWKEFYEKNRKIMRLISGIIMLILGITMITGIFARLIV